jgi:hypothetical protein
VRAATTSIAAPSQPSAALTHATLPPTQGFDGAACILSSMRARFLAFAAAAVALGCSAGGAAPSAGPEPSAPPPPSPPPVASSAPSAAPAAVADPACPAPACRNFATPAEAFEAALASKPLVVGIGEAHTQKDAAASATTAKRFTLDILPGLKGRATDLFVEILMPAAGCQKVVKAVRTAHAPVTEKQAPQNQDDYLAMGEASKRLGIRPDLLRPTCAELAAISDAGDDVVPKTLETIARLSVQQTKAALERKGRTEGAMVLLYGGALHNDKEPPPVRAAWSYGKEVSALANGRYVEIDVFGADQIRDDDTWKKQPWISRYDKAKLGAKVTLLELRPDAFVLILPSSS